MTPLKRLPVAVCASLLLPLQVSAMPTIEWTFHKSTDGTHPSGIEQARLWLLNTARSNPPAEGEFLASSTNEEIAGGRDFFEVDLTILRNEFNSYTPTPPAAFDVRLYNAAQVHSQDLINRDAQDHNNQFERIEQAGFSTFGARVNVFSFAESALNAHAALNIDWGRGTPDGMQVGRGHRQALMSLDRNYSNVGIASIAENNQSTQVGPLVMSDNFAVANTDEPNHFNRFIVGTVWQDMNSNARYDAGEGFGNVRVEPDNGTYFAITGDAGGFSIPIEAAGTFNVTFSGGNLAAPETRSVTLGNDSVLLDLIVGSTGNGNGDGNNNGSSTDITLSPQCSMPNQAIPDNDGTGISDTLTLSQTGTLSDLNVSLDISHTFIGDLIVTLQHVATGTQVELLSRPGDANCSGDNIMATLDDSSTESAQNDCQNDGGQGAFDTNTTYQPANALSAFNGEDLSGDWTLSVSDNFQADTGTLNQWCLIPTGAFSDGTGDNGNGDGGDNGNTDPTTPTNNPSFTFATGILSLPVVQLGNDLYSINMTIAALPNGIAFDVDLANGLTQLTNSSDSATASYDFNTMTLNIPTVELIGDTTTQLSNLSLTFSGFAPGSLNLRFLLNL